MPHGLGVNAKRRRNSGVNYIIMQSFPRSERWVVCAGLYGHVGANNRGDQVMGRICIQDRNSEGQMM